MSHITINIPSNQQPQAGYQQPMYQPQPGYAQPQQVYGQPQFQPPPGYAQPQIAFAKPQTEYGQSQLAFAPALSEDRFILSKESGFEELDEREGIFIKQKVSAIEVLTGCDTGNVYNIYSLNKEGEKVGKKVFKAKENSNCCVRQIVSPQCRPFQLKISLESDQEDSSTEPFLLIDRPCRCTFCCFERPEITVTCIENGKNEFLGRIREPWNACNIVLDVHDKNGNIKYKVVGSYCQLGLCCNCPFKSCETVHFSINLPSGEKLANLIKKTPGCCTALVSTADNFAVEFPPNAPREDKALLMCAALFLDFRYFEETKSSSSSSCILAGK